MANWLIPALFALSFMGLGYVLLRAFFAGADAYAGTYSESTAKAFEDVFLFIPPRRITEAGWAISALFFIFGFLLSGNVASPRGAALGLILGVPAGALGLRVPTLLLRLLKARRLKRFNGQLVDTLMTMSNALKAGFSITQAFESVVREGQNPIAQEFHLFLQQTRVGVGFSEALANLEQRVNSEDMSLVAMSVETSRRTGGNLTEIFERIAITIRERMRIENRIRTLTSQGRLQGIIVGAMPIVIGIAMLIVDPKLMLPFLHSTVGMVTLGAVAVLVTCGGLVIRKIINIDI